jgi:hypothetical protein
MNNHQTTIDTRNTLKYMKKSMMCQDKIMYLYFNNQPKIGVSCFQVTV